MRRMWFMAYLFGLSGIAALAARTSGAQDDATLKLFKAQCASCHGVDGRGQTTAGKQVGAKDWTDGKTLKAFTDDDIKKLIRSGKKGDDGKERMPAFPRLTDEQVQALVEHVRSLQK
jgi:mono/diheme cytochrome c family protein